MKLSMKSLAQIKSFTFTVLFLSNIFLSSLSSAQEPVRIAFMDPLTGTFASVGNTGLKQLQFAADH
ncbi:MAG: branched-chain amino acid transport system substrate-binding protein, partial [Pseudohongiellaceae bacterium]